jgi:Uma2 family endonuclease
MSRTVIFRPPLSDDELEEFCSVNDALRIERTSGGVIEMNPPTGGLTGGGSGEITRQLFNWWDSRQCGRVFDSNTGFFLPDGSMLSPDASYATAEQLRDLTRDQLARFPRLCPAFVIELVSPSDKLSDLRRKMERWMKNGAQLGWLIDPDERRAYAYEPGREPRLVSAPALEGTGPVEGFTLDLARVWRHYEL